MEKSPNLHPSGEQEVRSHETKAFGTGPGAAAGRLRGSPRSPSPYVVEAPSPSPTATPTPTPTPTPVPTSTPKPSVQPVVQDMDLNDYILNTNTGKFHKPSCSSVDQMKESNKQAYTGLREDVIARGYSPCGRCNP